MGEEDLSITFGPNGQLQFEAYELLYFAYNPVIRVGLCAEAFKLIFRVKLK